MNTDKYDKITSDSTINQDDIVRRFENDNYLYFRVTGYDENTKRYHIESFTLDEKEKGIQFLTSVQDLIDNFEKLSS